MMPALKPSPILSLTSSAIGNFDVNDSTCLASMWAVFSKCASSIENGRRLENLSWRLWTREALYDEAVLHHREEEVEACDSASSGPEDHAQPSSSDDEYYSTTEQEDEGENDNEAPVHPNIAARLRNKANNRHHDLKSWRPRQSQPQNVRARLHRAKSATITAASIPRHHNGHIGDNHLRTQQFKHIVSHQPQKPACHFYQQHKKSSSSSGCSYQQQQQHHHNQDRRSANNPPIPHCTRRIKSASNAKTEEGCYQHLQTEERSSPRSASSLRPKLSCERIKQIIDSFTPASEESNIWSQKFQGADPLISQSDSSLPSFGRDKNKDEEHKDQQKLTASQSISNAEAHRRTRASTNSPEKNTLNSTLSKSTLDLTSNPRKSPSVVRGFNPIIDYKSILAANNVCPSQLGPQTVESAHATSDLSAAKVSSQTTNNSNNNNNSKKGMFFFESSPEDSDGFGDSLRSVTNSGAQPVKLNSFRPTPTRSKTVDFKSGIETHESPVYESDEVAVEDDEDDDDYDDDDDDEEDDSDWDSIDDSQPASFDEKTMFHRGRPLLVSRPSMLSTLFTHQKTKLPSRSAAALANQRQSSQESAVFEDDEDEDQDDEDESRNLTFKFAPKSGTISKASNAEAVGGMSLPIPTPAGHQNRNDPLLSPRSTRRNMIASELSESLRRNLLWERKQKTPQVLTRARTSCDLTQLDQDKQQPPTRKTSLHEESQKEPWTVDNLSTSDYISEHGYHSRGW